MDKLLLIGSLALSVAGCQLPPPATARLALDVNNRSTNSGRPDSARMQVYCDGQLMVDTVVGNIFSGLPYPTGDAFSRHWLQLRTGRHRLCVVAAKYRLVLDTALLMDTLSFTSINLHQHVRPPDTLRSDAGVVVQLIPADTTSKITVASVPFARGAGH